MVRVFGWAVPGMVLGVPAIVAGFVLLLILSTVKFLIDNAKKRGCCPMEGIMKHTALTLLGYPTLSTAYSIGTGSLAGALSS